MPDKADHSRPEEWYRCRQGMYCLGHGGACVAPADCPYCGVPKVVYEGLCIECGRRSD